MWLEKLTWCAKMVWFSLTLPSHYFTFFVVVFNGWIVHYSLSSHQQLVLGDLIVNGPLSVAMVNATSFDVFKNELRGQAHAA